MTSSRAARADAGSRGGIRADRGALPHSSGRSTRSSTCARRRTSRAGARLEAAQERNLPALGLRHGGQNKNSSSGCGSSTAKALPAVIVKRTLPSGFSSAKKKSCAARSMMRSLVAEPWQDWQARSNSLRPRSSVGVSGAHVAGRAGATLRAREGAFEQLLAALMRLGRLADPGLPREEQPPRSARRPIELGASPPEQVGTAVQRHHGASPSTKTGLNSPRVALAKPGTPDVRTGRWTNAANSKATPARPGARS
jgi:hypothetical protein